MKRGQLSVFIIIGILLLVIGGLVYYLNSRNAATVQPVVAQIVSGEDISARVNSFVMACMSAAMSGKPNPSEDPLVWRMAAQGATFNPRADIFDRSNTKIDAWCFPSTTGRGCLNQAPSRESIAVELARALENPALSSLPGCLAQLTDPQQKVIPGGDVTITGPHVTVTINPADIVVRLEMNGTAKLQSLEKQFNDFVSVTPIPLGRMVQIGTDIINAEARNGSFDKDLYMLANGADVLIQKERPYPNIIYNLSTMAPGFDKPLILMLAVKGLSTQGTKVLRLESPNGCCVMPSGDCRANMGAQDCTDDGGVYNATSQCSCPWLAKPVMAGCCQKGNDCRLVTKQSDCTGTFFAGDLGCTQPTQCQNLDCSKVSYYYSDVFGPKKNGDSWCTSDTVTGFGTDFVGNRHYVHSCVDGKEYVEPCRDYREEICVWGFVPPLGRSVATCKTNRWYDCSQQKKEADCEDISKRDCFWIPSVGGGSNDKNNPAVIHTKMPCVPFVPPGFAFWSPSPAQRMECSRINQNPIFDPGPRAQGSNTLHICAWLGDCGDKRNWVGELTTKGYSNPVGKPKAKDFAVYSLEGWGYPIGTPLGTWPNDLSHYAKLYSRQRQLLAWVSGLTLADVMSTNVDPGTEIPTTMKKGAIKCKPWVAPTSAPCDDCGKDPLRPCTEYRCRALGRCEWVPDRGTGTCQSSPATVTTGPTIIGIDPDSLKVNKVPFTVSPFPVSGVNGYKLSPALTGNMPVNFAITTDKKAICTASVAPPGVDLQALDDSGVMAPELALAALEIPVGTGDYELKHPVSFFTPSVDWMKQVEKLFPEVTFYISCEDEAGNPSVNQLAVTIGISGAEVADQPPQILVAQIVDDPDEGHVLQMAMDEPVEVCKMSTTSGTGFDSMDVIDGCAPGPMDMAVEPWATVGSKTCIVPLSDPANYPAVVQCKDLAGNVGEPFTVTRP